MAFNQEKSNETQLPFRAAWFTFKTSLIDFTSLLSSRRM